MMDLESKGYWLGKKRSAETSAKISASLRGRPVSEEARAKIREALQRPEVRAKLSEVRRGRIPWNKGIPAEPGAIEKMAAKLRGRPSPKKGTHLSPELRAKVVAARAKQRFPFNDTKPEIAVQRWFKTWDIEFVTQYRIDGIAHAFDLAVPALSTLIEVDGCWFHRCPMHHPTSNRKLHDISKAEIAAKMLGWQVAHIWEHDIPLLQGRPDSA